MNSNPDRPSSPCISLCCLNDDNICLGCFRSINEITLWSQVDEKTRHYFLINAESRKKSLNTIKTVA
ncbi:MAG: DUF1289 domain-containing protein [Methylococcales bacterium]|nr:DUF1289 domain-containing protein [Methylococcales bacterium]MDD5630780.1 DUF1289 domain-containing protein [Methylococcales bacterium]